MADAKRGACRGCGRSIALHRDGRVRSHGHYVQGRRLAGDCNGTGQQPKPTYRFPGDAMSGPHNEPQF